MQYKTICLQMIQDRPEMYDQLLSKRILLPTLERYAEELRTSHQAWKDRLSKAKPGRSESQIANEALEMALQQLALSFGSPPTEEDEPFPLDAAMAFIRCPTPPA
jgi:hypothetical protein